MSRATDLAEWLEGAKLCDDAIEWAEKLYESAAELRRLDRVIADRERQAGEAVAMNREELIDLIAEHLNGTYHCHRVWNAWDVGTMSESDFSEVNDSDTPAELADAILPLLASNPAPVVKADESSEDIGRALLKTLDSNREHPALADWAPMNCPSEVVADLLNAIDEATAQPEPLDGAASLPAPQAVQAAAPSPDGKAEQLYEAIKDVLEHHRLTHTMEDEDSGFPLVDMLCPPDSKDIALGKDEVVFICDAIFNEVLCKTPAAPSPDGKAEQAEAPSDVVAFEFYNPTTGHAIVDYTVNTYVGRLGKEQGYEARPLGYVTPPPAAVKIGDPVPLWQAREALDSLEESARGDAPYSHFAANIIRTALEQAATQPTASNAGERELDLYDEIECDLLSLFGRASIEGHESGQRLARQVRTKMQAARAALAKQRELDAQYPLPDDLYDSKDWRAGSYAERVEWLHCMYEAKKRELDVKDGPMFWVRLCSDGMYEGPIHNAQIEKVRQQSGAWSPLFLHPPRQDAEQAADAVLAILDELKDDAAAHIFPSDLEKCATRECVVEVCSVRAGNPDERTVPLFSREQVAEAIREAKEKL